MPKSYSQFNYEDVSALGLDLKERAFLPEITPMEASDFLQMTLKINTRRLQRTEKAKSEFIIAPILYEIARRNEDKISFYSGYNFNVDKNLGLIGFCDFLFTKEPESPVIKQPVCCIAEAKNDNLERGIPQCIAEMYAAKLFNQQHKSTIENIYGCVTTGYQWQFLTLQQNTVLQDVSIYPLEKLSHVLGILQFIMDN